MKKRDYAIGAAAVRAFVAMCGLALLAVYAGRDAGKEGL